MFEYKIVTAARPETLQEQMNELVREKYALDQLVTTPMVTGVHYTAVMKRNSYRYSDGSIGAINELGVAA